MQVWSSGVKPLPISGAPTSGETVPGSSGRTCRSMLARSSSGASTRTWVTARVRPWPEGCSGLLLGLGASVLSAEKGEGASGDDSSWRASSRGWPPQAGQPHSGLLRPTRSRAFTQEAGYWPVTSMCPGSGEAPRCGVLSWEAGGQAGTSPWGQGGREQGMEGLASGRSSLVLNFNQVSHVICKPAAGG